MSTVLVTGGSGFVGSHCILQLLAARHTVRTTVRNLNRESDVRALLKEGGSEPGDRHTFHAADLERDDLRVQDVGSKVGVGVDGIEKVATGPPGNRKIMKRDRGAGVGLNVVLVAWNIAAL